MLPVWLLLRSSDAQCPPSKLTELRNGRRFEVRLRDCHSGQTCDCCKPIHSGRQVPLDLTGLNMLVPVQEPTTSRSTCYGGSVQAHGPPPHRFRSTLLQQVTADRIVCRARRRIESCKAPGKCLMRLIGQADHISKMHLKNGLHSSSEHSALCGAWHPLSCSMNSGMKCKRLYSSHIKRAHALLTPTDTP